MAGGYASAVEGEIIDPDIHNEYVRDQTVNRFTSSAARSSAITVPEAGMVSALITGDASEGIEEFNSAGQWRKPWNLPWGVVAHASRSTDLTSITTSQADITDLTVTWTAVANRRYRTTLYLPWVQQVTSPGAPQIRITDGSNVQKQRADHGTMAATDTTPMTVVLIETLTAGSVTRKGRANTSAGGVFLYGATSGAIMYLTVEDIGPSGAPS